MDELSWRAHPFSESLVRSSAVVAFLLSLSTLLGAAFGGWLGSALSVPFLFGSLGRWFFPTAYRLTPEGVELRFLGFSRRRPWGDFRALYPHRMGLPLSPFERPSGLDPFRGLFLRYAGNGAAVEAYCRQRIP